MKKFLTWVAIAFAVYWIFVAPTSAGHFVGGTLSGAAKGAHSVITFFGAIGS